ncbi:MAG: FkbM family methyltransferase [Chitinophagales bacterium]
MKQIFYKTIYSPSINKVLRVINRSLSPILPNKIKLPPSGLLTVKNVNGKNLKLKTNQTNYLTHLLFWYGFQNFEYTDIFLKLIKKVNVFYDIGANIGYYSLLAELENPEIKVVAFEPASGPLFYLKENVRINNFKNISIEEIALSEKNGEINFYEIRNHKYTYLKHNLAGQSNTGSDAANRNFVSIQVKTKTLDSYIEQVNEQNIDLIKMDTEGTEYLILEHSHIVLGDMKPIIVCETLFNMIETKLETIFRKYGYEFYNHTAAGLEKVDSISRKKDDGVRDCFFVHPSKFHLIEEFVK